MADFTTQYVPIDIFNEVPELKALLAFEEEHTLSYSGYFRIQASGQDEIDGWFAEGDARRRRLFVFGANVDGSWYALWRFPDLSLSDSPVVYIDSEDNGSYVLSHSPREFIGLLCLGVDELGWSVREAGWPTQTQTVDSTKFRAWASATLGILPIENPEQYVLEARASHPDFETWLNPVPATSSALSARSLLTSGISSGLPF